MIPNKHLKNHPKYSEKYAETKNSKIKCNKTLSVIAFEKHYLEFKYFIDAIFDSLPVEKKAGKKCKHRVTLQ